MLLLPVPNLWLCPTSQRAGLLVPLSGLAPVMSLELGTGRLGQATESCDSRAGDHSLCSPVAKPQAHAQLSPGSLCTELRRGRNAEVRCLRALDTLPLVYVFLEYQFTFGKVLVWAEWLHAAPH